MTNQITTEQKVLNSFISEFNFTPDFIQVDGDYAYAHINSTIYYCRLNTRGVKKNSWRFYNTFDRFLGIEYKYYHHSIVRSL